MFIKGKRGKPYETGGFARVAFIIRSDPARSLAGLFRYGQDCDMSSPDFVSFPPGLLEERPVKLSLLANTPSFFALEKPAGIAATRDAVDGCDPVTVLDALRVEIARGKRQLEKLGIAEALPVAFPDSDISGIFLCAKSSEAKRRLKNAMGGCGFRFGYRFLTAGGPDSESLFCQLPVAHHESEPRMLVSHRTGKKTETLFRKVTCIGRYALWEAESAYNRRHQVLLHAAESGMPVLGDERYGGVPPLFLSDLKPRVRPRDEKPLYSFPCLHQFRLVVPSPDPGGEPLAIEAPWPKGMRSLLARIERCGL